jgi:hypothetical protein
MTKLMLATINFAQTQFPLYSRGMATFQASTPRVYEQASQTAGHIESAFPEDEELSQSFFNRPFGKWGDYALPSYYAGGQDVESIKAASALSVWESLEALYKFVYRGAHLEAMKRKGEWFDEMAEPGYALWWTENTPTWHDGNSRLEHLLNFGPSFYAFTFPNAFDGEGNRVHISAIKRA